jgi:uncharacterized radical SAM superfamily protein
MTTPYPETIWNSDEKTLTKLLNTTAFASTNTRKVTFYAPSFMHYKTSSYCSSQKRFPTFSVTAKNCSLNCKHCGKKLLETMQPTDSPEKLWEAAKQLKAQGGLGCLVSGGSTARGSVPLGKFVPVLAMMKRELGLKVMVHTGLVCRPEAEALKGAGIDVALIDVIGNDETINQICHLNQTAQAYENSLQVLDNAGVNFVPHVIVGLQNGKLKGELQALKMIANVNPSAVVVIAFMPIRGTEMENVKPPTPIDIARVIMAARLMFPTTPLALGCMRPKGELREEIDCLALKAGVDGIAFPSEEAMRYAKAQGYETSFSPYCCSQIYVTAVSRSASK